MGGSGNNMAYVATQIYIDLIIYLDNMDHGYTCIWPIVFSKGYAFKFGTISQVIMEPNGIHC